MFCQTILDKSLLIDYGYESQRMSCRFAVVRETIRLVVKAMDSEGVSLKATYKLKRKKQICNGSNEIRQLEDYYKLKPFRFAIHGCINSLSRKIIWLCVASTNDPKVMASYFVDCLNKLKLGPKVISTDRESENIYVAGTQSCCHE